jgi:hypothetical protein
MTRATLATAAILLALSGCGREGARPEQPSPGSLPKPTVALPSAVAVSDSDEVPAPPGASSPPAAPAPKLFGAPGMLPAAERHFELFQRLSEDKGPLIKASL